MASKCRKFEPNIFNKLKCQACFGAKDAHSAEALENNKASRKISKCGYLFVAPDFDFSNPLDRSRRWQRRFFRLFDDGELTYCVDEDPETIPQGIIDMNKCSAVNDAEKVTSHTFSLEIVTPNKKYYIKGNSKEEYMWWHDVLQVFPGRLTKTKNRRFTMPIFSNKENVQPLSLPLPANDTDSDVNVKGRFAVEKVKSKEQPFSTYRGVRNMKHKTDKHYQEGLRKSSSLHDLSSTEILDKESTRDLADTRYLSRSGDRLDVVSDQIKQNVARVMNDAKYANNPYFTIPRKTWQSLAANPLTPASQTSAFSTASSPQPQLSLPAPVTGIPALRRNSLDDKALPVSSRPKNASERARLHRERSTSLKDFSVQMSLAKPDGKSRMSMSGLDHLPPGSRNETQPVGRQDGHQDYESRNNETDEHKMAKSTELQAANRSQSQPVIGATGGNQSLTRYEDLMYMKKGWLIKRGSSDKDCKKHWFVLTGSSLRYYKDAKAEDTNTLDGKIDLSGCYDIAEINIGRNYGFKIKTNNGEYILSAMTSGIRNNWMKAIRLVMDLQKSDDSNKKAETESNSSHQSADDLEVSNVVGGSVLSLSSDSRSGSESPKPPLKKETVMKNVRRHYSDVSPANIGAMLSIKDTLPDLSLDRRSTLSTSGITSASRQDNKSNEDRMESKQAEKSNPYGSLNPEQKVYMPTTSAGMPTITSVEEGADMLPAAQTDDSNKRSVHSESKKEEEERKRRAKSPSARIRERSRAKSPRQQFSVDSSEEDFNNLHFSMASQDKYDTEDMRSDHSLSEDTVDNLESFPDMAGEEQLQSASTSGGDGTLVELLETEVDTLKMQLDHTKKELTKSNELNMDLKTRLQNVVREKDLSQVTTMRRQVKEAREVIQKQKGEIDNLSSKLDMSNSKLTGTEKALSEALKDLKLEKDKSTKLSNEWNKKSRNLESQIKDTTLKLDRQRDVASHKERECKRLEFEVKSNLQKSRELEREILKLKAVEHEYKQLKEKFDESERKVISLRTEVKDKEMKNRKLESKYESRIAEMEQEFTTERDDLEQHMEDMKKKWAEVQRKVDMPNAFAGIMQEKDEIISQLEEKLIEYDKKMIELSEDLQCEVNENAAFQESFDQIKSERAQMEKKLKEAGKKMERLNLEKEKIESDNKSLKRSLEETKMQKVDISKQLDREKQAVSQFKKENSTLHSSVQQLHDEVDSFRSGSGNVSSDAVPELIQNFLIVESEMSEINATVNQLKTELDGFSQEGKQELQPKLSDLTTLVDKACSKCESLQDILKEGSSELAEDWKQQKKPEKVNVRGKSDKSGEEIESKEKELEDKVQKMEAEYSQQLKDMMSRIDNLAKKSGQSSVSKKSIKSRQKSDLDVPKYTTVSEEIEEQLNELEERINHVETIFQNQNLGLESLKCGDDEESSSEEEDDDSDGFLSSSDYSESEDEEEEEGAGNSGPTIDNRHILSKLKAMKNQLEITNSKVKDITDDLSDQTANSVSETVGEEKEDLKRTLKKYEEKMDSLTSKVTERVQTMVEGNSAAGGVPPYSAVAFQNYLKEMKSKLIAVDSWMKEHDSMDAKNMRTVHDKMTNLLEYICQLQKLHCQDFDILGKVSRLEAQSKSLIARKEKMLSRGGSSQEEKVHVYADRLSVEAVILGQMAYMIQRHQMGCVSRDTLMREIQNINSIILDLQKSIDNATRDVVTGDVDRNTDVVSVYAEMLAERIVLEGQLASCAMAADNQNTDDTAILSSLNISDNPSILAMEVFLRSQVDSSVHEELSKVTRELNSTCGHIVTRTLVQGEISHALQKIKRKLSVQLDSEEMSDLLRQERKFSYDQLKQRVECVCSSVNTYQSIVASFLRNYSSQVHSKLLDVVSLLRDKLSTGFQKQISELREELSKVSVSQKEKLQHIIVSLESNLESAKSFLDQICDSDFSESELTEDCFSSVDDVSQQLTNILIQKSVLQGSFTCVEEYVQSGKMPSPSDSSFLEEMHTADNNQVSNYLSQSLIDEATSKQTLAAKMKTRGMASEADGITEMVDSIPTLFTFDSNNLSAYGKNLVKEAMFQAQLTYTKYKTKLQHDKEMRDMKIKLEAGQKVYLPSETNKETENDIQQSLSVFEEILETKFEDECEVLSILDKELKQLQSFGAGLLSDSDAKQFEQHLNSFAGLFEHELSVAQERHDVHLDVLRQEITSICLRMEKMIETYEQEKELITAEYEEKIQRMQDEVECLKIDHEEELEQVRQDILTAVSAIRANEEQSEEQLADQVKTLSRQCASQRDNFIALLEEIQDSNSSSTTLSARVEEAIEQLQESGSLQTEVSLPLSPLPVVVSPTPMDKVSTEVKDSAAEELSDECKNNGHLDRSQHDFELQLLKREKDEALAEEVKTTKAALDAMRKAYEEDLEEEKDKYREALKTMFTDDFVDEIRKRHESEVGKLEEELKQVNMHYSSKCEDYKLMEDKVTRIKKEYDSHISQLIKSNEQLNNIVNEEIGKLKDYIQNRTMGRIPGNSTIEEELYDAQILVRVKDAELQKLRGQVKNLENNLERATEEQRQSMTQYLQIYKKHSELQNKLKQEAEEKSKDDGLDRSSNRSLRRTPSFHHRARSPSPQPTPSKKEEHHSRDSHKRRHLDAKDLKRSKSSPSLPFIFDTRLQATSVQSSKQRDSLGTSKYGKSSKSKAS